MTNISPIDALGDPTRRQLFERLWKGACSVMELMSIVPVSQPAVSQHLRVLKEARLVKVVKRGRQSLGALLAQSTRAGYETGWDYVLEKYIVIAGTE